MTSYAITCARCIQTYAVELNLAGADDRALYEQLRVLGWELCALQPIGDAPIDIETSSRWWCPRCIRQANIEVQARQN